MTQKRSRDASGVFCFAGRWPSVAARHSYSPAQVSAPRRALSSMDANALTPYPPNVVALSSGSPHVSVAQFECSEDWLNGTLLFYIIFLKQSLFVYIGTQECDFTNISLGMAAAAATAVASTSDLLGNNAVAARIAAHIAKKYAQHAYVSYNVPSEWHERVPLYCEKQLFNKLDPILLPAKGE